MKSGRELLLLLPVFESGVEEKDTVAALEALVTLLLLVDAIAARATSAGDGAEKDVDVIATCDLLPEDVLLSLLA